MLITAALDEAQASLPAPPVVATSVVEVCQTTMPDNRIVYANWEGHPALVALDRDTAWAFINGSWRDIDRVDAGQNARVIDRASFMRWLATDAGRP